MEFIRLSERCSIQCEESRAYAQFGSDLTNVQSTTKTPQVDSTAPSSTHKYAHYYFIALSK